MQNVTQHLEVFSMGKNVTDILAEILILLIFSNKSNSPQCQHLQTSMLKGESHVSCNVPRSLCNIVDDGGNYVTFHKLNIRLIKDKKNNSSSQWELRPSVFQCDRFAQICLLLARPSS